MSATAPVRDSSIALRVIPTGGPLGADIVGVDLSQPLSDETFQRIHAAWMQHLVLRFRGQQLAKDDPNQKVRENAAEALEKIRAATGDSGE